MELEGTNGKTGLQKARKATVLGGTGLIGGHLVQLLENDASFEVIRLVTRRPVLSGHRKVQVAVIDFVDRPAFHATIDGSDVVFCAVGTTQKQVRGDRAAYRKVDFDIPVLAAQFCAESGCPHFLLVSSVGADVRSKSFYLQLKGEVEEAIKGLSIPRISIFRPSMLLGKREEFRPGEMIGQVLAKPLAFVVPSNYRPIAAHDVARAMIAASRRTMPGCRVYHYKEMMDLLAKPANR